MLSVESKKGEKAGGHVKQRGKKEEKKKERKNELAKNDCRKIVSYDSSGRQKWKRRFIAKLRRKVKAKPEMSHICFYRYYP